jgi:hypothetical protein
MSIGLEVDFTCHDMPTCHIMSVLFILFAECLFLTVPSVVHFTDIGKFAVFGNAYVNFVW